MLITCSEKAKGRCGISLEAQEWNMLSSISAVARRGEGFRLQ